MAKYIIKRIFYSIIILFIVSFILYSLVRLFPADFVTQKFADKLANQSIPQGYVDELRKAYGLDLGIIEGYGQWVASVFHGELGLSFNFVAPVADLIAEYMWISFGIAIVAYILQFIIAIPLGIRAATHQYGVTDYTTSVLSMIGISFPSFLLGMLLIEVFGVELGWFPIGGMLDSGVTMTATEEFFNRLWHLILPMITIVIISIGSLMRHTRTNTLEVLNQDYIRTARAKGLSERSVVYKHVFRNTMVPIVTMMAGILPGLFGGMMILEDIFKIEGIGQMAYQALLVGDIPFIMGYNMFLAILTVLGTLLSDIAYMLVDPRIKITK